MTSIPPTQPPFDPGMGQLYGHPQTPPPPAPYPMVGAPGVNPYYPAAPAATRSAALGRAAFITVAAATVLNSVLMAPVFTVQAQLIVSTGSTSTSGLLADALDAAGVNGYVIGWLLASLASFAGLILGIVATATRRGRGWGIAAIVTWVCSPLVFFATYLVIVLPAIVAVR